MNYQVNLKIIAKYEWEKDLPANIIESTLPPHGSLIEVPGPRKRLMRPALEPFTGSGGILSRIILGDKKSMSATVSEDKKQICLSQPPLGLVSMKSGGIWVLNRDQLVLYDNSAKKIWDLKLPGITILRGKNDAVWVIGVDQAWHVEEKGVMHGPFSWSAGFNSTEVSGKLCALGKGKSKIIKCLDADGKETRMTMAQTGNFERLLIVTKQFMLTAAGNALHRYDFIDGSHFELPIHSLGLDFKGEPFISGWKKGFATLWADNAYKKIPVPDSINHPMSVVAVKPEKILVYGLNHAFWHSQDGTRLFEVDDKNFEQDIFPYSWQYSGSRYIKSESDGSIILSSSGPDGSILVGLKLTNKL